MHQLLIHHFDEYVNLEGAGISNSLGGCRSGREKYRGKTEKKEEFELF